MEKLNAETLDTLFANPNVQNMAELIGKYESNNQYDINVGGAKIDISDGSKHPRQFDVETKEGKSSAAGRYQITSTTFDDIISQNPQAEITDFSPTSQNRAFVLLLQRRKALEPVLKGDYTTAVELLANEFASLPSAKTSQPRKGYDEVERDFAFYKRPKIVPRQLAGDLPPVTPDQIKNANFSVFGEFVSPDKQPSSYDIAASIQFLSENQTQSEKDFLSAVSLGAMPKKGKIDPLSKFLKESAQDETPLDVMVEKQEPRNKVPSIEGVKKFQDGGEVEFKMPRSALVGDDIIEIPESQRKVTLTMNDLENLADAASFVPVPQVKFPAKATKGIMSLLKLDKIDPFLQKGYQDKLQKEYLKDHMDDALGLTYVQKKLEKVFPGFQVKPKKKFKIDLATGELYDPSEPSMGKMRNLSKEGLKRAIALSAQTGKGLTKRDIGNEPYILNPMEYYQLSKKDKDFIKNVVRKNYPDFGVKSDASTMRSQAIEQSYDRLLDFVGNKLRRKSMGIGKFYRKKEIDDQFTDTVLNEALKEIDSITKFRDQRKVDSVFSELMKKQQGR